MTREQLNQQPAQLVRICNKTTTIIKEGTRSQCWNAKAQTFGRYLLNEGNTIVILKK